MNAQRNVMIKFFRRRNKRILFSLRFSILFIFVMLFVITTIVIAVVRSIAFSDELTYTSFSLMQKIANIVSREVDVEVRPVELAGRFSANLLEGDVLKNDTTQLVPYIYNMISITKSVPSAYWGNEQGDFIYLQRHPDGTISTEIILRHLKPMLHTLIYRDIQGRIVKQETLPATTYDPRKRPWYLKAKQWRESIWTDIYTFYPDRRYYSEHEKGISIATPAYFKGGKLMGVFGIDLSLAYLTQFITHQKVSQHGYAFIITKKGNLIAYPMPPLAKKHSPIISQPLIYRSLSFYNEYHLKQFSLTYKNETYLINYKPIFRFAEQDWIIGIIAPKSDFVGFLQQINFVTLLISIIALLLSIVIVSRLSTRVVKPIDYLVRETEKIRQFKLEGSINVPSRIKEVVVLRNAIISMRRGLRQFQRYVPKLLVRQLIESGEDIRIGGVRKQLVVLFSDIENFTTIAEKMDPTELMEQICEYFEVLTQVILSQKGTIDKYIGDSIMAFWGAPLPEESPCEYAALAALQCQEKIAGLNDKWAQLGKPKFVTRIGIHKGEAIVGNIGSLERVNYTAVGDTINISSRLESINKVYQTHILVSDTVYQEIKGRFVLRMIDRVVVKGRTGALSIYELLGDDFAHIPFDVKAYQSEFAQGFTAYTNNQWRDAMLHFQRCFTIYPKDKVAPLFIKRCKQKLNIK